MKTLAEYINEAAAGAIKFQGSGFSNQKEQEYVLDTMIQSTAHHDLAWNAQVKSISDIDAKSLLKQGVKCILAYPPHKSSGGDVDYYIIKMFISKKRIADKFRSSEVYALYDLKSGEFTNGDKIRAYEVIRLD